MVIGITGPSGAGKTTVSDIFSFYGYKSLDADKIAKNVIDKTEECKEKIKEVFGPETISKCGDVNRPILSECAFKDRNTLYKLGEITFPYIVKEIELKVREITLKKTNVVIDAVALFESGVNKLCDYVILITASENERINRIIKRDNITRDFAIKRIKAQTPNNYYINKVDFVFKCVGDKYLIDQKVKKFLISIGGGINS